MWRDISSIFQLAGYASLFAVPVLLVLQLALLPVALKTCRRKAIPTGRCLWLLVPYIGIVAGYWIACAPERPQNSQ